MCVTLKHQIFHKPLVNYLHCKVAIRVSPVKQPTGLVDSSPFQPPALQFVLTFTYRALSQGLESWICPTYSAKFWQGIRTLNISYKPLVNYLHCKVATRVSPVKQLTGLVDSSHFQPPARFAYNFSVFPKASGYPLKYNLP